MRLTKQLSIVIGVFLLFNACLFDKLPEPQVEPPPLTFQEWCDSLNPTYNTVVKPILQQSCAYDPACHPSYNNYSGLQAKLTDLQNGPFVNRVFTLKDDPALGMPPDNSVYPQSIKDSLTQEELDILQCWIDKGAPEN